MYRILKVYFLTIVIFYISALCPLNSVAAKELEVVFINVGFGDCALVITPEGKVALVDTGNIDNVSKILNTLNRRGIGVIDVVITTRPVSSSDGLLDIMQTYRVNKIIEPGGFIDVDTYDSVKSLAQRRSIPIEIAREGLRFMVGSVSFEVLSPSEPISSDIEDKFIVINMTYGSFSTLFTSDIPKRIEDSLIAKELIDKVTVLKVAKHGGSESTSKAFLGETMPQYAVISVDADNKNGYPSQDVLARLSSIGVTMLRTDLDGSIVFTTDGSNTIVTNERSSYVVMQVNQPVQSLQSTYIGSKDSDVFHYSTCPYVALISESNLIQYASRAEAITAGKRPCFYCNP